MTAIPARSTRASSPRLEQPDFAPGSIISGSATLLEVKVSGEGTGDAASYNGQLDVVVVALLATFDRVLLLLRESITMHPIMKLRITSMPLPVAHSRVSDGKPRWQVSQCSVLIRAFSLVSRQSFLWWRFWPTAASGCQGRSFVVFVTARRHCCRRARHRRHCLVRDCAALEGWVLRSSRQVTSTHRA